AGAIWHDDQVIPPPERLDHALESAQPSERRVAAYRADTEAFDHPRDDLAVAVGAVHNAGLLAAIGKQHEQQPIVPKRQDHLVPALPACEQLFGPNVALARGFS